MLYRGTIKRYPDGQESLAIHEFCGNGVFDIVSVGTSDLCAMDLNNKARSKFWDARHKCTVKKPTVFYYHEYR
jgi:hypothetical protein